MAQLLSVASWGRASLASVPVIQAPPHSYILRPSDHALCHACPSVNHQSKHHATQRPTVRAHVARSRFSGRDSQDDVDIHEPKLGPGVIAGVKDLDQVKWAVATVMRNDAVNLDGSVRLLHLSVPEHVDMLYGRRVKGVPDSTRWIDAYTLPGQCIGVRVAGSGGPEHEAPKRLFSISSSPYASRRDSAYVDASIIEIMVERHASPEDSLMAELGPGAQVEVTQVIGRGFTPLLGSYNGALQAIEEGRALLLVGMGTRGAAALRATLNWQPVLAHASSHPICALVVAHHPANAPCLAEWDGWREAGIKVRPLYTEPGPTADARPDVAQVLPLERCQELLEVALFASEGGFEGVCGGNPRNVSVLLAGLPRELASKVAKQISAKGVDYEHILFCDYF